MGVKCVTDETLQWLLVGGSQHWKYCPIFIPRNGEYLTWGGGILSMGFCKSSSGNMVPDRTHFAGLIVTMNKHLDRETQDKYEVVVKAEDAQGSRWDR